MPNYCNFNMRLKGEAAKVDRLCEWLGAIYNYDDKDCPTCISKITEKPLEHHIGYRVFDFTWDDIKNIKESKIITVDGFGECAWSTTCCMFETKDSYISDNKTNLPLTNTISLPLACKILKVEAELFSSEPGVGFAEHFYIDTLGRVLISNECEYSNEYVEGLDDCHSYEDYLVLMKKLKKDAVSEIVFNKAKSTNNQFVIMCSLWDEATEDWKWVLE